MYVLRNLVKLNCCSLPWKSITVLWGYLIMFDSDFRVFTFVTANYSELGFARWMLLYSAFYIHYVMTKRLWYKSQFGVMSWLHHFPGMLVASRVNLRAGGLHKWVTVSMSDFPSWTCTQEVLIFLLFLNKVPGNKYKESVWLIISLNARELKSHHVKK